MEPSDYFEKRVRLSRLFEKIAAKKKSEENDPHSYIIARKLVVALYMTRGKKHFEMEKLFHAFRQKYPQECENVEKQMKKLRDLNNGVNRTREEQPRERAILRRFEFFCRHAWLAIDQKPQPLLTELDMKVYKILMERRPRRLSLHQPWKASTSQLVIHL